MLFYSHLNEVPSILRNKIFSVFNGSFVHNVVVLAGGTAASQLITMVFSPVITRLYGPEAYGVQGVFMTIVNTLSTVAALSYPVAIVLPRDDSEAFELSKMSIFIGVFVSLLFLLVFSFSSDKALSAFDAKGLEGFAFLIPLAIFLSVLSSVIAQWLIRKKEFVLTSKVGVLMALLTTLTKSGVGAISPSSLALILINTLSGLLSSVLLYHGLKKNTGYGNQSWGRPRFNMRWDVLKKYSDFALLRTPQNLLNVLSQGIPVLFLSVYFGAKSVGYFSIAMTVLAMPSAVIGGSVMQVFYPRFNDASHGSENAYALLLKATGGMAAIGFLPFLLVGVFGQSLFGFVFGQEWVVSGLYSQWLSVGLFFTFLNRPCLSAIAVMRRQGLLLIYECASLAIKIGSLCLGYIYYESDIAAIAAFSLVGAALNAAFVVYVLYLCKANSRRTVDH